MSRSTPRRLHQVLGHVLAMLAAACLGMVAPQAMSQRQTFTSNATVSDTDLTPQWFRSRTRSTTRVSHQARTGATEGQTPPPASAPPKSEDRAEHASAQEVCDAFIAAAARKDWKGVYRCFAPESHDLVVVQLMTMFHTASAVSGKGEEALHAILVRHEFDLKKAWSEAQNRAKAAGEVGKKADWHQFVRDYGSSIKDKEAFFSDLLNWADEFYAGSETTKTKPAALEALQVSGDTASGTLSNGTGDGWKVCFKKVGSGWRLDLPAHQFAPSGWNDGFLFDYLDATQPWRF